MKINFEHKKLETICNNEKLLIKEYGKINGKKIKRRLDDLSAANNLEEARNLPGKCHELVGDRKGQLAVHVEEPLRLIFKPNDPVEMVFNKGPLNWKVVVNVTIIEIKIIMASNNTYSPNSISAPGATLNDLM